MLSAMKMVLALLGLAACAVAVEWQPEAAVVLDPASQTTGYGGQRSVAVDPQGNLHVVWLDGRGVPPEIRHREYDRTTGVWQAETVVSSGTSTCQRPAVACDAGGRVHVAWHSEAFPGIGIWYCRRSAAGVWQEDTLLQPRPDGRVLLHPALACEPSGNMVHMVYYGLPESTGMSYEVFHQELVADSGWRTAEQITTAVCNHSYASVAVTDSGDIGVVWVGGDIMADQIHFRCRLGGVWQAVELVSNLGGGMAQYSPCIAADRAGNFHVVWHGRAGGGLYQRVYYRQRTGSGWSGIEAVSEPVEAQQQYPACWCREDGSCHVAWAGQRPTQTPAQVKYARRSAAGAWSAPEFLTDISTGTCGDPGLACDSDSGLHVVWWDTRSGDKDIWWRAGYEAAGGIEEVTNGEARMTSGEEAGDRWPAGTLVRVYDARGGAVGEWQAAGALDMSGLRAGVYFVKEEGSRGQGVKGSRVQKVAIVR